MPSPEFHTMVGQALGRIIRGSDRSQAEGAWLITEGRLPLNLSDAPSPQELVAAGAGPGSTLLGLFQYSQSKGANITIYELPIRKFGNLKGSVEGQVEETIRHELDHFLGRNHVLQTMRGGCATCQALVTVGGFLAAPPVPVGAWGQVYAWEEAKPCG